LRCTRVGIVTRIAPSCSAPALPGPLRGGGSSKFAFQKPLIRAAKWPHLGALGARETRRRANILAALSQIAFETLRIRRLNNEDDREQSQVEPMFPGNDPMLVLAKMRAIWDLAKARISTEGMATGPASADALLQRQRRLDPVPPHDHREPAHPEIVNFS